MTIRVVHVDTDGTLSGSNALHVRAWLEVFAERDVHVTAEAGHAQIGRGADLSAPALVQGADDRTTKAFGDAHGERFKADCLAQVRPFPYAHDLLARIKAAGPRAVLASSASKVDMKHYLRLVDVRGLADAGTSIDDFEMFKRAPGLFARSLKRAGAAADQAMAVGDIPHDVKAAGKVGVQTIALRSGGSTGEELKDAGAVAPYDDVAVLLAGFNASTLNG